MTRTLFPSFNINEDTIKAMIWQPFNKNNSSMQNNASTTQINVHCTTCTTVCVILVWPRLFTHWTSAKTRIQNFFVIHWHNGRCRIFFLLKFDLIRAHFFLNPLKLLAKISARLQWLFNTCILILEIHTYTYMYSSCQSLNLQFKKGKEIYSNLQYPVIHFDWQFLLLEMHSHCKILWG